MIVQTSNSMFVVDFAEGTVTRKSNPTNDPLRRDDDPVRIIDMDKPVVGEVWEMVLDIREDGVQTLRRTSEVAAILALDEYEKWNDSRSGK